MLQTGSFTRDDCFPVPLSCHVVVSFSRLGGARYTAQTSSRLYRPGWSGFQRAIRSFLPQNALKPLYRSTRSSLRLVLPSPAAQYYASLDPSLRSVLRVALEAGRPGDKPCVHCT